VKHFRLAGEKKKAEKIKGTGAETKKLIKSKIDI
jgi:hypothetical protein